MVEIRLSNFEKDDHSWYDRLINNWSFWKMGFAVKVYFSSDDYWYPGQMLWIWRKQDVRFVEVTYNGKKKSLPVTSEGLKPLITYAKWHSRGSFKDRFSQAEEISAKRKPKQEGITLDAFISHSQQDSKDAVAWLQLLLKTHGLGVRLSSQENDICVSAMSIKGIAMSCFFVIFLMKIYFERVFTILLLETTVALKKPVIVIWE